MEIKGRDMIFWILAVVQIWLSLNLTASTMEGLIPPNFKIYMWGFPIVLVAMEYLIYSKK